MTAYLDSSIILRLVLGQPDRLSEWGRIEEGVTSALAEVECLRTLDRVRLSENLPDAEIARRREAVFRLLEEMTVIEPGRPVLNRASQPLPTPLGTLDAIHLASALIWRERGFLELVMATHDGALGTAARACGLRVIGV